MENDNISNGGSKLEDRLSSLPDAILVEIFSLLPLKSAVTSAALSRRWRTVWTHLTAFRHYSPSPPAIDSFPNSVFQICGDHVKIIDIGFCVRDCPRRIPLPSSVFECKSLETLKLGVGFDLKLPDDGIRLPNLRELHVNMCDRDVELMGIVFRSCPRLEKLLVMGILGDYAQSIDIACPNLKWLRLSLCHYNIVKKDPMVVINAPKLERLCIYGHKWLNYSFAQAPAALVEAKLLVIVEYTGVVGKRQEFIRSINSIRSLTLYGGIFFTLSNMVMPIFESLTNLTGVFTTSCCWCWEGFVHLLRSCPSLEVLVIEGSRPRGPMDWSAIHRLRTSCLSISVKTIRLEYLEGHDQELELISFILSVGKVLETLDVNVARCDFTSKDVKLSHEVEFCDKICMLPRISSTCQINFFGQYYHTSSKGITGNRN